MGRGQKEDQVNILVERRAEKELLALPVHVQRRFKAALDDLSRDWLFTTRDVLRLQGRPNGWRLRVGQYRCLFEVTDAGIVVTAFLDRSTAYRL